MSHHDEDDCPYFWFWLLDGLPFPVLLIVAALFFLVWAFKHGPP